MTECFIINFSFARESPVWRINRLLKTEVVDPKRRLFQMPGNKHLRGVSDKEQRQYEHILESAKKEGRYKGRAKEVAARTVLKLHQEKGHPKGR